MNGRNRSTVVDGEVLPEGGHMVTLVLAKTSELPTNCIASFDVCCLGESVGRTPVIELEFDA